VPTRDVLSPAQRAQFTEIPDAIGERELVRYYTFTSEELAIVAKRRRPHNRLGFGVQLCYLRFPGRPLRAADQVPEPVLAYIAAQLDLDPAVMWEYAQERDGVSRHGRSCCCRVPDAHSSSTLGPQEEDQLPSLCPPALPCWLLRVRDQKRM